MTFDVVRTETGFSMDVNGKLIPIPIGYMRISEAKKLTKFMHDVIDELHHGTVEDD